MYDVIDHAQRGHTNASNHLLVSFAACEMDTDVVPLTAEATLRLSSPSETIRIRQVLWKLLGAQIPHTVPALGMWHPKSEGGHTWMPHLDDYPLVIVDVAHSSAIRSAQLLEIASLPLCIGLDVAIDDLDGYAYDSEWLFALCSGALSDSRSANPLRLSTNNVEIGRAHV